MRTIRHLGGRRGVVAAACLGVLLAAAPFHPLAGEALRVAQAGSSAEDSMWALVKDSEDADLLQRFVDLFPAGTHAEEAQVRIRGLSGADAPGADLPTLQSSAADDTSPPATPSSTSPARQEPADEAAQVGRTEAHAGAEAQNGPFVCAIRPAELEASGGEFGRQVGATMDLGSAIAGVRFSDTSSCVLAWSEDGTMKVWEAATGRQVGATMHSDDIPVEVSFGPGGASIVAYDTDFFPTLWDVATGQRLGEHIGEEHSQVVFDPLGRRLLSWSINDGSLSLRLFDSATGQQIGDTMREAGPISTTGFSEDGSRFLSTSRNDGKVIIWDAATATPILSIAAHKDAPVSAMFIPHSGLLMSESANTDAVKIWDAATGTQVGATIRHGSTPIYAYATPAGTRIVTASSGVDGEIKLWDPASGKQVGKTIPLRSFPVARFNDDGTRLLTWNLDGGIRLWDSASGRQIGATMEHGSIAPSAHLNSNETRLFSSSRDGVVKLWDAATGAQVGKTIQASDGKDTIVTFDATGTRLFVLGNFNPGTPVTVWETATATLIGSLPAPGEDFAGAQYDWDSRRLVASWTADGRISLWDAEGEP